MITILLTTGSVIIGLLGLVHLIYTFKTNKFEPRDSALAEQLRQISPVLTSQTTMWKAWIGFNASHSIGALLFALFYGYLALCESELLLSSWFLMALSLVTLLGYLWLAKTYWFKSPLIGIFISLILFTAAYILNLLGN